MAPQPAAQRGRASASSADLSVPPALNRYLAALFADTPPDSFIEVRFRVDVGMGHSFHPVSDLTAAADAIRRHAATTDVYVGVLPRQERHGGVDALISHGHVVWADCDTPAATAALRRFEPQPSVVVSSGTRRNVHSYWLLAENVGTGVIANLNTRIATALGADVSCADPARILRPPFPGRNHKHHPPAAVWLVTCDPSARHAVADITAALPYPPQLPSTRRRLQPRVTDDPLLAIAPHTYAERLLGVTPRRDGKVTCPYHPDDRPSLHVYAEPHRGWYCYGCRQGGSIYDLASRAFGLSTRGADFIALRQQLVDIFGLAP